MNLNIYEVSNEIDLGECTSIRKQVFYHEEKAPEELYVIDDFDKNKYTKNFLLKIGETPVGTIRFIKINTDTIKLQRMAVLKEFRKNGYAKILLNYLENKASKLGYKKIILDSAKKT